MKTITTYRGQPSILAGRAPKDVSWQYTNSCTLLLAPVPPVSISRGGGFAFVSSPLLLSHALGQHVGRNALARFPSQNRTRVADFSHILTLRAEARIVQTDPKDH